MASSPASVWRERHKLADGPRIRARMPCPRQLALSLLLPYCFVLADTRGTACSRQAQGQCAFLSVVRPSSPPLCTGSGMACHTIASRSRRQVHPAAISAYQGGVGDGGGGRGRGGWGGGENEGDSDGGATAQAAGRAAASLVLRRRSVLAALLAAVGVMLGFAPAATADWATDLWMRQRFRTADIPDVWQSDPPRHAIVTGANSGTGLETAAELARKGWVVILACRSLDRGRAALDGIRARVPDARLDLMALDVGSQQSVRAFDTEYRRKYKALHLLINNAGIMLAPYGLSQDGIEQTFATNYLGPFLLTNLLLPLLIFSSSQDAPSRVVNVGSEAHRWTPPGGIQFHLANINDASKYLTQEDRWQWYGHSKLALLLFTKQLDASIPKFPAPPIQAGGTEGMAERNTTKKVLVNCVHPGLIKNDLFRTSGHCFPPFFGLAGAFAEACATPFFRSNANGALTTLWAATSPAVLTHNVHGEYVVPCDGWRLPDAVTALTNRILPTVHLPDGLIFEPWVTAQRVAPMQGAESDDARAI